MSEVSKLVKLLIVMPATNAESERSFSSVRRTYQDIFTCNYVSAALEPFDAVTCAADSLSLGCCQYSFISGHDHRKNLFGTEFKPSDL